MDYPRVCGGTRRCWTGLERSTGLSPRVRGNLAAVSAISLSPGTIPACAGEPSSGRPRRSRGWDYPRVCGGTSVQFSRSRFGRGLSPRVRGNLVGLAICRFRKGTIPACAGEPSSLDSFWGKAGDYPRVCGGTIARHNPLPTKDGLSPRVRGNLCSCTGWRRMRRTIPACAGEPVGQCQALEAGWDYPRVCGGTKGTFPQQTKPKGLSPRVRGNLIYFDCVDEKTGTIPACAGEPFPQKESKEDEKDYPRVCGGTRYRADRSPRTNGLSPRVRGNQGQRKAFALDHRTIPACAGEPGLLPRASTCQRDYPRVCGGTRRGPAEQQGSQGLSPRVRGNHEKRSAFQQQ